MRGAGNRPVIGLTGRRMAARVIDVPAGFHDAPLDIYMSEYATAVLHAGGIPLHLPLDMSPEDVLDLVDGVVFVGGADVDPRRYGGVPHPRSGGLEPLRDQFELDLAARGLRAGVPMLGICRGAQLLNVALGGTLVADLPIGVGESHASYAYPRAHRSHAVSFTAGSALEAIYGPETVVNSFHHQAVDRPGRDVVVTGRADDGVVEAFEVADRPVVGVQWHPECFTADPIFNWLVDASVAHKLQESAA
ncbi:gamma-glutamyl-gamma-aminobutyrate hydrolase family protein [Nocardioides nitrophenolicus]|uniref:gamma-glutamyl-gamma-aminobutyrate hydrolase family protein n=1 Tax=Nocardioides nitrophenolicus TaxID=60489 RepID=UPI001956B71B|nr:gamma-glutamyl-gamma-aminobutyrate hydrolase family protein [Nocardioides nitrophenolicus]MBM7515060.1 putative glutamine amidotransferase [Nocardioides nitrophenolicus]